MHWVLLIFMQGAINAITFDDYQSCINAGNQIMQSGNAYSYACAEK